MSTSAQTWRPLNLNVYIGFDVESEFEVKNCQFLRLDPVSKEKLFLRDAAERNVIDSSTETFSFVLY